MVSTTILRRTARRRPRLGLYDLIVVIALGASDKHDRRNRKQKTQDPMHYLEPSHQLPQKLSTGSDK